MFPLFPPLRSSTPFPFSFQYISLKVTHTGCLGWLCSAWWAWVSAVMAVFFTLKESFIWLFSCREGISVYLREGSLSEYYWADYIVFGLGRLVSNVTCLTHSSSGSESGAFRHEIFHGTFSVYTLNVFFHDSMFVRYYWFHPLCNMSCFI